MDRLLPQRPFPEYAFLPGRDPHPTRSPDGHSFSEQPEPAAEYYEAERWAENGDYLYGIDLYNHGYLWEAHEAWEGLWHQAKHDADQADCLQGLIQCAAGALKIPMGQPKGLEKLAAKGLERLERVARAHRGTYMGLDLQAFIRDYRIFVASRPEDPDERPRIRPRAD